LLYLRNGQWDGRQVIPGEWVAEATRPHIATAGVMANPDWRRGYGFQFWMARHGYRGDGAYGQFCLVLPEHDTVVAITAGTENLQGILDTAWTHLLPAFGDPGTGSEAADAALADRLSRLRLPVRPAGSWPAAASAPVMLTPDDEARDTMPSLRRVTVQDRTLTLSDGTVSVELRLADGGWQVTDSPVPVAASGGWTRSATLALDVVFLETPHRLSLTCSPANGTFGARWATAPLGWIDSLSRLRSPAR
jgi:hypothetical protein